MSQSITQYKRKRGRPRGTRNGKRFTEGWEPQKWKPLYELIVVNFVSGVKQNRIAEDLSITPELVGLVLNSAKGKVRTHELMKSRREALEENFITRVDNLQKKALDRISAVLNDDSQAEARPFHIFDRSLRFLQATRSDVLADNKKSLVEDNSNVNNITNNTMNILINDSEIAPRIREGLSKVMEIKSLHSSPSSSDG